MKYDNKRLDELQKQLSTAVLCDILDDMGYRNQAMKGRLSPLREDYKLAGIARTVMTYDVYEMPVKPYEMEIQAVDSLQEGEVIVCSNPSANSGIWGELLANAAIARGARGAVVDGAVRDIRQLLELSEQFQVFSAARNPLDSKGRCLFVDYNCPIVCDGVRVEAGDFIFADIDGIVIVPAGVMEEACSRALEKVKGENLVRDELREGKQLKDVFAKYNIL